MRFQWHKKLKHQKCAQLEVWLVGGSPMPPKPKQTPLSGVADEWEDMKDLRKSIKANKSLFVAEPLKDHALATVACAQVNFDVLAPLAKRLRDESGNVGMHTVPCLEEQSLEMQLQFNSNLLLLIASCIVLVLAFVDISNRCGRLFNLDCVVGSLKQWSWIETRKG